MLNVVFNKPELCSDVLIYKPAISSLFECHSFCCRKRASMSVVRIQTIQPPPLPPPPPPPLPPPPPPPRPVPARRPPPPSAPLHSSSRRPRSRSAVIRPSPVRQCPRSLSGSAAHRRQRRRRSNSPSAPMQTSLDLRSSEGLRPQTQSQAPSSERDPWPPLKPSPHRSLEVHRCLAAKVPISPGLSLAELPLATRRQHRANLPAIPSPALLSVST